MFAIEFTDERLEYPYDDANIPAAPGLLVLGESREDFLANLAIWDKRTYEIHWTNELRSLVAGTGKVALIVSFDDPAESSNMEIWRLYREGQSVIFQNQFLFYDSLPRGFEVSEISKHIEDRKQTNERGDRISEWIVSLQEIETFLARQGRGE